MKTKQSAFFRNVYMHKTWNTVSFNYKDHIHIWNQVKNGQDTKYHEAVLWKKMWSVLQDCNLHYWDCYFRKYEKGSAEFQEPFLLSNMMQLWEKTSKRRPRIRIGKSNHQVCEVCILPWAFLMSMRKTRPSFILYFHPSISLWETRGTGGWLVWDRSILDHPRLLHDHFICFSFLPFRCYLSIFPFRWSPFRNLEHPNFKSHLSFFSPLLNSKFCWKNLREKQSGEEKNI